MILNVSLQLYFEFLNFLFAALLRFEIGATTFALIKQDLVTVSYLIIRYYKLQNCYLQLRFVYRMQRL